jgi:adenine-specific DNA-methyltransferase
LNPGYYRDKHLINAKDRKDLAIFHGLKATDDVGVIIETKAPKNKSEMISRANINGKALHEIILYYLRERITKKNTNIKNLIVTNVNEWFIFDGVDFEKLIANNKKLVKEFQDFERDTNTTKFFYTQKAKPFIDLIVQELPYTYFDIKSYLKAASNNSEKDDKKLIALYKLLSPEHLLKKPFANDSNTLDKSFYNELLHITGLEEVFEKGKKGKKVIGRKKEMDAGSLIENAMNILEYDISPNKLYKYGDTNEERKYNAALELSITWINRILFLKLLESQLISYHKGDRSYAFLTYKDINNYDALNKLFFQILAVTPDKRRSNLQEKYKRIPYLNSSLFEPSDVEVNTIRISGLEDDPLISIHDKSVLRDHNGKREEGQLTTLEYIFRFLDSYDFSSEGSEEIQEENKALINASVLGLIFEKINGYKEGSVYTPGFITMYMCKETLQRSVLQKFNDLKGWKCDTISALKDKIEDRHEANEIINNLKICDPAVGSGHFLVSMLNEMIALKSELGILSYRDGSRVKYYQATVEYDELMILEEESATLFEYKVSDQGTPIKELQKVQEMLFHEKERIIEGCLFGVDINPNSVKICRLRLWIELLKNAYYGLPH